MTGPLPALPDDVLLEVVPYLPSPTLARLSLVSRHFNEIIPFRHVCLRIGADTISFHQYIFSPNTPSLQRALRRPALRHEPVQAEDGRPSGAEPRQQAPRGQDKSPRHKAGEEDDRPALRQQLGPVGVRHYSSP